MNMQNSNSAFRMTWVTLAALSATMLVGVSHAAPQEDVPTQDVSYQDLDLNSNAGVQALYQASTRELARWQAKRACVERAVSEAVAAVNSR